MTDEPTEPVDEIVEPDEQPDALPEKPAEHEPPPWVEGLVQAIESIPDKVAEMLPNPVAPEVPILDEPDEPASKPPWTHRGF